MKLNEKTDMWVVVNTEHHLLPETLSPTKYGSQDAFMSVYGCHFPKKGYRCIPVTVTIKERPL